MRTAYNTAASSAAVIAIEPILGRIKFQQPVDNGKVDRDCCVIYSTNIGWAEVMKEKGHAVSLFCLNRPSGIWEPYDQRLRVIISYNE